MSIIMCNHAAGGLAIMPSPSGGMPSTSRVKSCSRPFTSYCVDNNAPSLGPTPFTNLIELERLGPDAVGSTGGYCMTVS